LKEKKPLCHSTNGKGGGGTRKLPKMARVRENVTGGPKDQFADAKKNNTSKLEKNLEKKVSG